jgi:hypothetical protein
MTCQIIETNVKICINRGRRIAIKEANRWNRFLQTDQARLIFQQSKSSFNDALSFPSAKASPDNLNFNQVDLGLRIRVL